MTKLMLIMLLLAMIVMFAVILYLHNSEYERKLRQKDIIIDRQNTEIENLKKELMRK